MSPHLLDSTTRLFEGYNIRIPRVGNTKVVKERQRSDLNKYAKLDEETWNNPIAPNITQTLDPEMSIRSREHTRYTPAQFQATLISLSGGVQIGCAGHAARMYWPRAGTNPRPHDHRESGGSHPSSPSSAESGLARTGERCIISGARVPWRFDFSSRSNGRLVPKSPIPAMFKVMPENTWEFDR
jgi:hypothetical protein